MEDQQVLDMIGDIRDAQQREMLRAQFEREGRSAAFWEALGAALQRQAAPRRAAGTGAARWVGRTSGRLLGRAVRHLEQESIKLDEAARKKGQLG